MATLPGQRAQFTWALNEYNKSDDPDTHIKFARRMAKYIAAAPSYGFNKEEVTQGRTYPAEVDQYVGDPSINTDPEAYPSASGSPICGGVRASTVLEHKAN